MAENIDIRELNMRSEQQSSFVTNLVTGMDRVIVGQKHLVDSLLIGLLSDGNILLEGVYGVDERCGNIATGLAVAVDLNLLGSLVDTYTTHGWLNLLDGTIGVKVQFLDTY